MAKRPNLGQITSSVFTVSQLNTAYDKIDTAFDNTLSRDGSTPNTMLADLDMNSNDILNVGVLDGDQINVNEAYIGGKLFTGTLTWRSDWLTATSYQELDLVKQNGNVYVALEEHTSGVFASDLSALRWELFVENATGPAGPTGDTGATGPAGQGVPTGGTTGQVLAKVDGTDYNTEWVDSSGGSSDHGALTGLGDDDHTQYHNNARGDARYYTQTQLDAGQLDTRYFTESEVTSALSGKADTSHTHSIANVTGLQTALDGKQASGSYAAATHTHTASQVTDFSEAVDDRVSALLVAGTDISLSYNDASNTLTITSTAPGGAIEGNYMAFYPHHISNYDTYTLIGVGSLTMSGSRYTPEASVGTPLGRAQRVQVRFTGSSTTNCASVRSQYTELFTVNGPGAGIGGFKAHMLGAPSVGCTNSSHRFFMGVIEQKASLPDQNPSGMTNFVGIGYDSADSQLHIMHNDGSGSATKVALGASFPKPTSDNSVWYRLRLTAPADTTRTIDWEVTELQTGAVASGTITTDLPATDKFVSPAAFNGVGGVSAPISLVLGNYVVYS